MLIFILLFLIYRWIKSPFDYWKKRKVPSPAVSLIFGNIGDAIRMKRTLGEIYKDYYNEFKEYAYIGFYRFRTPGLIVRDPELIKTVLISNFSSFHDNDIETSEKTDPLLAKNPFILKGERWKVVRNQITPCFSTGKIKALYPIMQEMSRKFVNFIEQESQTAGEDGLETKELCTKYTTENVVNCAFGLEANCFKGEKSIYREMGSKVLSPDFWTGVKLMLIMVIPDLSKFLSLKMCPNEVDNFFRNLVNEILELRKDKNIKRNDFVDNLLEIKAKDPSFTLEDLTGHCIGLFIDGYETSSVVLSFILYNLAANPVAQEKLRQEIDEVIRKDNANYEGIQELTYLDAVLNESLRMYPPGLFSMKKCTKDFNFPPSKEGDKPVLITKGTPVMLPLLALHMDPKYFPNPDKFEPERFLGEKKNDVVKCSFLPFGDGPRTCLGQRFGIAQTKVAVFHVIANFDLRVSQKTKQPLELDPNYFMCCAKGGLWLKYYRRKKE